MITGNQMPSPKMRAALAALARGERKGVGTGGKGSVLSMLFWHPLELGLE